MKIIKRSILFSFLTFCFSGQGYSQNQDKTISVSDFKNVLKKVDSKMQSVESFSVAISYLSFEKGREDIIHDKSSGYFKKDKNKFHSLMVGIHSIQNESERIEVDTINRIIAIANPISEDFKNVSPQLSDFLLTKTKSIMKTELNGATIYELHFDPKMPFASYRIEINNKSFIQKIDITYNRKIKNASGEDVALRVRIIFNEWNLSPHFTKSDFSENVYVIKKNDKFFLKDNYSEFTLVDQRVQN